MGQCSDSVNSYGITHGGLSACCPAGMLFGWELILAFILVSTVYACAIGAPNFGNIAPLAVGVSLALDLMAAAAYSGGGVSPVRVLGPAIVFHCNWDTAWVYMLGGRLHQFCQKFGAAGVQNTAY